MDGIGVGSTAEQSKLTLDELSERLRCALTPVQPNPAYVRSLREEIVGRARQAAPDDGSSRRTALIAAAAVGSVISIASVVGAVVFFITRRRAHLGAAQA